MSDSILKRMFNSFVKDAEPGEILEASKLVNKDEAPAPAPAARRSIVTGTVRVRAGLNWMTTFGKAELLSAIAARLAVTT